jgi:hypothetical protein
MNQISLCQLVFYYNIIHSGNQSLEKSLRKHSSLFCRSVSDEDETVLLN